MDLESEPAVDALIAEKCILAYFKEARRLIHEGEPDGDRMWRKTVEMAEAHGIEVPAAPVSRTTAAEPPASPD